MTGNDDVRAEIEALRAEVAALRARVGGTDGFDEPVERRHVLRRLGTVAAGVAAGTVGSVLVGRPAAAADGQNVVIGNEAQTAQSRTGLLYDGSGAAANPAAFFVTDGAAPASQLYVSAIAGQGTGAHGLVTGVAGTGTIAGLYGSGTSTDGGAGYGAKLSGTNAAVKLATSGGSPLTDAVSHTAGEITFDDAENFWACVATGTPGTWRKLAGPATAGQFHPIAPIRVFDSRITAMGPKFTASTSRNVSIKDSRNLTSGAVIASNVIPSGARAVTGNVTIAETEGSGYVTVTPGGTASTNSSTVNWSSSGAVIANAFVSGLDSSRRVKVFCFVNSTHVILDITGYYL